VNKTIKAKWTKALREGKYKQGQGRLYRVNDQGEQLYCCLGVLCDLYAAETHTPWEKDTSQTYTMHNHQSFLPNQVIEWAEIKYGTIGLPTDLLIDMNDGGKTFEEIAEVIEKRL